MKEIIFEMIKDYINLFPKENNKIKILVDYLKDENDKEICDWNNVKGHITAGAFIYSAIENKFLMLYHRDLKTYLYPGGHAEIGQLNPLDTAKKEIGEEIGIYDIDTFILNNNKLIPIDIDIHMIPENKKYNMPSHLHYDFRYLVILDNNVDIKIDLKELKDYKWIEFDEFSKIKEFKNVAEKIKNIIKI